MALWTGHHGVRRFASAKWIPCAQAWHHILSAEPDLEAKTSLKSGPREFVAAFHCSTWVIPIRLKTDTCPVSGADRADALWVADEEAPSRDARIDDGVIAVPDDLIERTAPQELPDVLPRIELRSIGRQVQERDVLRRMRTLATLVPAGAV